MRSIRTRLPLVAVVLFAAACSSGDSGQLPSLAITSLLPAAGSSDSARAPEIAVTFGAEVDFGSLRADQIEVRTARGRIAGTTTIGGPRQLRFVATAELPWGTTIHATLRGGLRTRAGATMVSDVAWSYRVVDGEVAAISRPIASGSPTRRAVVASTAARNEFAVAVDGDLWGVSTLTAATPPQPYHETFPFLPTRTAASADGSLMGVRLVDLGTATTPDLFLQVGKRDALGIWQNADVRVLTGSTASLFTHEGGQGGAFVTQLYRAASATTRALVGPRATAPVLAAFDSPNATTATTVAALGLDTAVVCQAAASGGLATFTRYVLGSNPPTAEATWTHAFGVLASDANGDLLVLAEDQGRLALDRLTASGAVDTSVAVEEPATMPLAIWRILPADGAAAAIAARFGVCSSFRLDASENTPRLRSFDLDQDAIDSGAWDACYSPNGDLVVVARIRSTPSSEGRLVLWRQRPGQEWEQAELVAEIANRPLGRPGIAVDPNGLLLAAAPRTAPDEVVVVQWRAPVGVPAPR